MRPFHLAFPVDDLQATEQFYVGLLGCAVGRRTERSINLNFHGHQIVAHLVERMPDARNTGRVDGRHVPPFHFGLIMEWNEWHTFRDQLLTNGTVFRLKPHVRYRGQMGEQSTMFIDDPSGNALEFKSFQDESRLFAASTGGEYLPSGGAL